MEILVPTMLSVSEDAGVVTFCISLSSDSRTQREVIILINTEDELARGNI